MQIAGATCITIRARRAAPEIVGLVVGNLVRPNNNPNVYETIPEINAAGVLP
jgi:hypothetical protein